MLCSSVFDPDRQPQCKIELHVHLDGAVRLTTIWELMQKKGHNLSIHTLEDLYKACSVPIPSTLANYLKRFEIFSPFIVGDGEAIERIAYEFCEDTAKQGVLYCEARCIPHLLSGTHSPHEVAEVNRESCRGSGPPLTPRGVLDCVIRGFERGQKEFGIKVRSILGCYRPCPSWSEEVLDMCVEYRDRGVVGIDIGGFEADGMASPEHIIVFQRAAALGVHRTAHAGEAGPASNVSLAVNELQVERVGHGYHVVDDPAVYLQCREAGVHFETCPHSSLLTGAVARGGPKHPIVRFAEDNVNFSISRDDPTIVQKTLDDNYSLLRSLGLKDVHFARANFNAARSCFLPDAEKKELLAKLMDIYGVHSCDSKLMKPHVPLI